MTVQGAHEVASAVERNSKRVAGSETQALAHVEPATPPRTRPNRLFGDVQAPSDSRGEEGVPARGADDPPPGDATRDSRVATAPGYP